MCRLTCQRFRVLWAGAYEPKKSEGAPTAPAISQALTQATLFEAAA